jgi:hypothetical protein
MARCHEVTGFTQNTSHRRNGGIHTDVLSKNLLSDLGLKASLLATELLERSATNLAPTPASASSRIRWKIWRGVRDTRSKVRRFRSFQSIQAVRRIAESNLRLAALGTALRACCHVFENRVLLWHKAIEANTVKSAVPDLPCEDARGEQVVCSLMFTVHV